jgi:hypothetical protein
MGRTPLTYPMQRASLQGCPAAYRRINNANDEHPERYGLKPRGGLSVNCDKRLT